MLHNASTAAMRRERPLQSPPFGQGTQPSTTAMPREKRSLMRVAAKLCDRKAAERTEPPFAHAAISGETTVRRKYNLKAWSNRRGADISIDMYRLLIEAINQANNMLFAAL